MQYRDIDILPKKSVGDSGTETVDLDVTDPITELSVTLDLTNGGAKALNKTPVHVITKIEVVDGGTVYASLTGPEAFAAFFYETGHVPVHLLSEVASEAQAVILPLRFGRYLGDPLRNLDATKLRNPQIKVTWAKDSLHLASSLYLTVKGKLLTDVPGAPNALLIKDVRSFTTAASGDEDTELPTDYPIRKLYVRPWVAEPCAANILSHYKIDCDSGKFIPLDMSGWDLQEEIERIFGYAQIRHDIFATNGDKKQTWLGYSMGASVATAASGYIANLWCSKNSYGVIYGFKHDGTSMDEKKCEMLVYGCLPYNVFCIPFGLPDDPATWFPAAAYRKVNLRVTQAEADATAYIAVQQDRPI